MISKSAFAALGLALAVTACSEPSTASSVEAPAAAIPAANETAVADAGPQSAPTPATGGNCIIQVGGRTWLDRPCAYDYTAPDLVILNSDPPEGEDYVYLFIDSPTTGNASWSGGGGAAHAHDPLGDLTREGSCWVNADARICLPPGAIAALDGAQ